MACLAIFCGQLFCQELPFLLSVAWPLVLLSFLLRYSPVFEDKLYKWLKMYLLVHSFIFYLPIEAPHQKFMETYWSQNLYALYLHLVCGMTYFITYDLYPSHIIMHAFLYCMVCSNTSISQTHHQQCNTFNK
jgi:hypothetical protein